MARTTKKGRQRHHLTPKQQRFVEEYLVDLNATQAAIRAGYSQRSGGKIGHQLLEKTRLQQAILKAMERRSKRIEVTQDRVLLELGRIAFADMGDFAEWGPDGVTVKSDKDLNADQRAAIAEVSETKAGKNQTIRFKLHDKKGALDALAKHLGMFIDRHEHGAVDGVRFKIDLTPPSSRAGTGPKEDGSPTKARNETA